MNLSSMHPNGGAGSVSVITRSNTGHDQEIPAGGKPEDDRGDSDHQYLLQISFIDIN